MNIEDKILESALRNEKPIITDEIVAIEEGFHRLVAELQAVELV